MYIVYYNLLILNLGLDLITIDNNNNKIGPKDEMYVGGGDGTISKFGYDGKVVHSTTYIFKLLQKIKLYSFCIC